MAVDDTGPHLSRLAEAQHRESDDRKLAKGAHALDPRPQILDLGNGEGGVFRWDAWRALADVYQPVFVTVDERLQQHAADDAENGGIGADPEGEREDDSDEQPFGAEQRTDGQPQFVKEGHTDVFNNG